MSVVATAACILQPAGAQVPSKPEEGPFPHGVTFGRADTSKGIGKAGTRIPVLWDDFGLPTPQARPAQPVRGKTSSPPQSSPDHEKLRRLLKASIDRQLAHHVKRLRKGLHDAVDAALADANPAAELDRLLAAMEASGGAVPSGGTAVSPPAALARATPKAIDPDLSRRIASLEAGLAQLSESLGANHPAVQKLAKSIEGQKRELMGLAPLSQAGTPQPVQPSLLDSPDPAKLIDDMMKKALKEVMRADQPSSGQRRSPRKNIP